MAVSINLKMLEEYCLNLKKLCVQYFVPNSIMTTDIGQIKTNKKRSQVTGEYTVMILVSYREPLSSKRLIMTNMRNVYIGVKYLFI